MDIRRRQLFRGDISGREQPLLPPWSCSQEQFYDQCSRCGDCITACPEKIIIKSSGGFPAISFQKGECTFCGECASACQADVISMGLNEQPWDLDVSITRSCLCLKNVTCMTCADQCEVEAIRLEPRLGSCAIPRLDSVSCTGCGACFAPCPANAIMIKPAKLTAGQTQSIQGAAL